MSYQVSFSDITAFCAEIQADKDRIDDSLVRCEIDLQTISNGCARVFVKAGFLVDGQLRQVVTDCGTEPPSRGEKSGAEKAVEIREVISNWCEALSLELRSGVFE